MALVTPAVRLETRTARSVLSQTLDRASWVQQMANTAALVHGFATGDRALALAPDTSFAPSWLGDVEAAAAVAERHEAAVATRVLDRARVLPLAAAEAEGRTPPR